MYVYKYINHVIVQYNATQLVFFTFQITKARDLSKQFTVLLMFLSERRLSIGMLYFVKSDDKIILPCIWGSGGTVSFGKRSLAEVQGASPKKNYVLFTSGWQINSLKYRTNRANELF